MTTFSIADPPTHSCTRRSRRRKEEGRRKEGGKEKKEEGRRKKEEGRRKKEEGRRTLTGTLPSRLVIILKVLLTG